MADKMIFPIGFDLEAAVKNAGDEWDKKYADRLEKLIAKRPVNVKFSFDTTKLDSLDDVKKRLAQLKIEPITPENQRAIKDLVRELKELARIMERVQKFKGVELPELQMAKAAKLRKDVEQANEKLRLSQERVRQAEERLILSQKRAEQQAYKTGRAYQSQDGYISRLLKRLAVYAGFSAISNFLTSVREVTAEFELQRVSLGAIIQDQQKANALFSEIKNFALKSPVSILDLTKYTKQVAAYGFQTDKLFETTKMLADISIGLGADMSRATLFLGQVYARTYLQASELRQATELGIPLVDKLAKKLEELNGRAYTASDVMDLISKRAISYEMVEQVFKDMTSAGGEFYNMQEKQGNTLYGLWAKLGDAASVMYDEIGNTDSVNSAMKTTIGLLTDLMKNWREVGRAMATAGVGFAAIFAVKKVKGWQSGIENTAVAARQKAIAAEYAYARAVDASTDARLRSNQSEIQSTRIREVQALSTLKAARAEMVAANATTLWSKAWNKLKAAFLGNWLTLLLAGLAAIAVHFYNVHEKANRLKNTLNDITKEAQTNLDQSLLTFQRLAKTITETTDGSRQQQEALSELHRTYGDMIPIQDMTVEKLRAMKGNYEQLTIAIKEYAAQQLQANKTNTLLEAQADKLKKINREIENIGTGNTFQYLQGGNWQKMELSTEDNKRIKTALEEFSKDTSLSFGEAITKAFESVTGLDVKDAIVSSTSSYYKPLFDLYNTIHETYLRIEAESELTMETLDADLLSYANRYRQIAENIKNTPLVSQKGTFEYDKELERVKVSEYINFLKELFEAEGLKFDMSRFVLTDGEQMRINWTIINEELDKGTSKTIEVARKAAAKVQNQYNNMLPTSNFANTMQASLKQITESMGGNMDRMKRYLAQGGDSLDTYRKKLQDWIEEEKASIQEAEIVVSNYEAGVGKGVLLPKNIEETKKDIAETTEVVEILIELLNRLPQVKKTSSQSDPRLGILQEMVSTLKQVNKEYDDLAKKEGATKALADTQRVYADTFKNMQQLAAKYKFNLPDFGVPTDAASLTKYLDTIKKAMAKLPKSDKAVLALQVDIEKLNIDDMQKKIEQRLKELSDKIARTKTAREFYDKILSQTGDVDLAANVTMSIYGDTGEGLFDSVVEQIRQTFTSGDAGIDLQLTAEIDAAIDTTNQRINYQKLAEIYEKYQNDIIEKNRDTAQKIVSEGQKTAAANVLTWEKMYAKAKSYEEQRTDIIKRETEERAKIYKSNLPQEEKDKLAELSRKKQEEDIAKMNFEEFTKSEDYIKIFENLDNTSTAALKRLREEMKRLIETNKELSPENMKTLVKAMEDIDEQISGRGFGNDMVQGVRDYIDALRDLKTARAELQAAQAEYDAQLPQLDADIAAAKEEEIAAQEALNALKAQEVQDANAIVAAELRLNAATNAVTTAEQAKAKAAKKVKDAEVKVTNQQDKQRKATTKFVKDLQKVASEADQLANTLSEVKDLLGISEDSAAGLAFDSAVNSLQMVSKAIGIATTAQALFNAVANSNPYVALATGVLAVGAAITSWISGSKVRKANKEIKRQQELLEGLEYTYGRLQKAAAKLFGRDYLDNYNQQLKNLQAQQTAYLKQAAAERSKGKKADKDKIKEYEEAARETADAIAEMQADLVAHFTGSSKTDIARQMAKSWIEARASMSDTFAAIKKDYAEMVKNMIVEGAAARVIENALSPMWTEMDKMLQNNNLDAAIDALVGGMDDALNAANNGMEVLWKALEARGYDMKQLISDTDTNYTGIKRDIAGASEETMSNVAMIGNTLMYYVSPIPRIDTNLAAILALMEGGKGSISTSASSSGWTDWQQQAMDSYLAIQRNTADTVVECRRAAVAAENAVQELRRVIVPKSGTATHVVQVRM